MKSDLAAGEWRNQHELSGHPPTDGEWHADGATLLVNPTVDFDPL